MVVRAPARRAARGRREPSPSRTLTGNQPSVTGPSPEPASSSRASVRTGFSQPERSLKLTRDEGLVLFNYLTRWYETDDLVFRDEAERAWPATTFLRLEKADDGTAFAADYAEQVAAARHRLRPEEVAAVGWASVPR